MNVVAIKKERAKLTLVVDNSNNRREERKVLPFTHYFAVIRSTGKQTWHASLAPQLGAA